SIVERAQALINHEPLQEAMDQAKALQSEWKSIGITRHREDRKLWQSFRQACDQIFERRDAQRSAQQQATEEADAAARAVVAKYRDLGTGADDAQINEAKTELKLLADAPLSRPVRDEVQTLRQHLAALGQQRKLKAKLDNWKTLINERSEERRVGKECRSRWWSKH